MTSSLAGDETAYLLEVVGGADDKACLLVGQYDLGLTIGRAPHASLCLSDPTVSRLHLGVFACEDGVQLAVRGTARHFLLDGHPTRSARARAGQTVVVGKTSLAIHAVRDESFASRAQSARTDVTSLLTGVEGDTRGLASVHALIEALDAANDEEALHRVVPGSARAFLGTSKAAQLLASTVPRLAASDASVLIDGETGVGKSFFARLRSPSRQRSRHPNPRWSRRS